MIDMSMLQKKSTGPWILGGENEKRVLNFEGRRRRARKTRFSDF